MASFAIARRGRFRSPVRTRYRTRFVRVGRAGVSLAARVARDEKHTMMAVGAAAVLGFAKRENVALPKIDALGTAGTYGLLAWALGRYSKNPTLQHLGTGLLSVAAAELASGQSVSGDDGGVVGFDGDDTGDDD